MPNKRTYENQSAVDLYGDSHYVEERAKEDMAEFVLDSLRDEDQKANAVESVLRLFGVKKDKLTILDAGIGSGKLLLLPLVDRLLEENTSFEIIGIDISDTMISKLKDNLKTRGFEKTYISESGLMEWINNGNRIRVFKHDLDSPLPEEIAERCFDLVLAVSTLHHLRNWRIALSSLVDTLKPGGHFVLYEATNGLRLRDGTFAKDGKRDQFEHTPNEVPKFWKDFYQERNDYHLWNPEICASDHSAAKRVLKKSGPMTPVPPSQESICFEWEERVTRKHILQLISDNLYSNFYRGLDKEERKELTNFAKSKSKEFLPEEWEEKNGCEVTICRKAKGKYDNDSSYFDYALSESSIFPKITEKQDVGVSELFAFATLLIQHDFITPRTLHFTLNSWDLIEENWKSEDKPEIFNLAHEGLDEYLPSFLLYRQLVRSQDISATKLIFRKFARKVPLVIHRTQEQTGWRIDPTVNREEKLRRLDVYLSDDLIDTSKRQCLISSQEKRADEIVSDESNWRSVGECISHLKVGWTESDDENLGEIWSSDSVSKGIEAFESAFENEPADAPWLLPRNANKRGNSLEALVKVLLRHLCMTEWDTITYVSAESRTPQEEGGNGKDSEAVGFGGIILVEENEELRDSESYLENRLPALETAVNLKYRDLGVLEHAKSERHRVKRHALQSFLSEVYARNFAHNIGSHVATNATNAKVKERIKELYPNG